MIDADVAWDMEDDPDGNVQHIAEHGVAIDEVEEVLADPDNSTEVSVSTSRDRTRSGRLRPGGISPWPGSRRWTTR